MRAGTLPLRPCDVRVTTDVGLARRRCAAPTSQGLQTNHYTALLHTRNHTLIQLYHGSTGAIMFRSGPQAEPPGRSITAPSSGPQRAAVRHGAVEELTAGHRRVCWLGWDGSVKEGLEGRQDFSSWLCPEVCSGTALARPVAVTRLLCTDLSLIHI